ncbi:hypothetical protein CI109_102341 [Kwoniella shandongensis]|uniref:Amidohydrolase-related domain-containing protein n=1 Tax=Kwoniella shandongensis TaxID=1734106 RepID=A0AAJ8LG70_9TREE
MPVSYPCTPYNTPDLRYWPCRRNLRKGSDASTPQVAKESAPSPAPIKADQTSSSPPFIVLTNPYLILPNGQLSPNTSLCIDKDTGLLTALPPQAVEKGLVKEIDLGGKWVSPGMIDIQVNGSWSCSFSSSDKDQEFYEQNVKKVSAKLCKLGVTSYLPHLVKQNQASYNKISSLLAPFMSVRSAATEEETPDATLLGLHLNCALTKNERSETYVRENCKVNGNGDESPDKETKPNPSQLCQFDIESLYDHNLVNAMVKMITLSPQARVVLDFIPQLVQNGWTVALGSSKGNAAIARKAVCTGARLLADLSQPNTTRGQWSRLQEAGSCALQGLPHLDDSPKKSLSGDQTTTSSDMLPLKQQNGKAKTAFPPRNQIMPKEQLTPHANSHNNGEVQTPWFLINGYTLHQIPLAAKLAYEAHPTCCVLASGAPHLVKPPSKSHFLSNEEKFKRRETRVGGLYLEGTGIWIGWVTWLLEAVFQLSSIAHISVPQAIVCATYNPANMLGGEVKQKVGFRPGCWADLVIWDPKGQGRQGIKGVWKGGKEVWYEA